MNSKLSWVGMVLGLVGVAVVIGGLFGRFYGESEFLGHRSINWVVIGIALITMANWAKLYAKSS